MFPSSLVSSFLSRLHRVYSCKRTEFYFCWQTVVNQESLGPKHPETWQSSDFVTQVSHFDDSPIGCGQVEGFLFTLYTIGLNLDQPASCVPQVVA